MAASSFKLEKWYLDFVSDDGVAAIMYAALLQWKGITLPYASFLYHDPAKGIQQKSGIRSVSLPELHNDRVQWHDYRFQVEGEWQRKADTLSAIIYDSEEGTLDWTCHQPSAKVVLKVEDKLYRGTGYVEQLTLTALPWKIPMRELRWGRVHVGDDPLVWVELLNDEKEQWIWFKGKRCPSCTITNDKICCPNLGLEVQLENEATLEKGKTIGSVVDTLTKFLPGFKSGVNLNFLMADCNKWLSNAKINWNGTEAEGKAIHEWVNFNTT